MSSKSVTALLAKNDKAEKSYQKALQLLSKKKTEKCPQKALQPFWETKLKNVLKKRYGPSGKKGKK